MPGNPSTTKKSSAELGWTTLLRRELKSDELIRSYSLRSTLDSSSRLWLREEPYLAITIGLLPGILYVPGYDVPKGVPGLGTGEEVFWESFSEKWNSWRTISLLLNLSARFRFAIVIVRFLLPKLVVENPSLLNASLLSLPSSIERLSSRGLFSSFALDGCPERVPFEREGAAYPGSTNGNDLLRSSPPLREVVKIFVKRSCLSKFCPQPSFWLSSCFLRDSKLRERLSAPLEWLFSSGNWNGFECMGRAGAVRGDGMEAEPLLTVDWWFDIGPVKQGKNTPKTMEH